jgi:carbamoyl-phosphate synthase large subunit
VDTEERGTDFDGIDVHYVVPAADSPDYIPGLLELCRKERVDIVVPWSDDEVGAVSSNAAAFQEHGTATLCGSSESVRRALDKGKTLQHMVKKGMTVPAFELASSSDDIERAAKKLGYPREKIVVKPCCSSGGRGMWILDSSAEMLKHHPGPGNRATLSAFLFMVRESESEGKTVPDYVMMEFLPGQDYSVDALANEGEAVYVIPRKRIKAVIGISHIGEAGPNPEVRSLVARVIKEFDLHLNVNVQMKYSKISGGHPLVYEINPRVSGSIVANDATGVTLLYYGIRLALGLPIPSPESIQAQGARMFRRWVGRYTDTGESFKP